MGRSAHRPVGPQGGSGAGPRRDGAGRETLWWLGARVTLALGLCSAFLIWGAVSCLAAAAALAVASWALVVAIRDEEEPTARFHDLTTGALCGSAFVAAAGLVTAFRWLGVLLLVALLLTAPGWRSWARRVRRPRPAPEHQPGRTGPTADLAGLLGSALPDGDPGPAPTGPDVSPAALDDEALCREWRTSFVRLQAVAGATARARVVERRQAILDELSRRHEAGVARWLASGARAAGNPRRFLEPEQAPRPHEP